MDNITSAANKLYKETKKLSSRRERYKNGVFIAEGKRLVEEALSAGCVEYIMMNESYEEPIGEVRAYRLSDRLFDGLADTVTTQGIIAVCRMNPVSLTEAAEGLIVVCDGISDPGNLGTIIRTAECAGASAALLGDCTDPYNAKTVRATMGSIFRIPICQISVADLAGLKDYDIVTAMLGNSTDLYDMSFRKNTAVIIGSEALGVSAEAAECASGAVRIPMSGGAESLNAAVAAAIIMYEVKRQTKESL